MHKALTLVLLLTLPLNILAETRHYASGRLKALAEAGGTEWTGGPVVVESQDGVITHIGMDIFRPAFKEAHPLVCRFVERYLLELEMMYTPAGRMDRLQKDGVVLEGDILSVLRAGKDFPTAIIVYNPVGRENGRLEISRAGNRLFAISFPPQIELLSGKDKVELEASFLEGIASYAGSLQQGRPRNLKRIGENLYVSENGYYETEAVQHTSFFKKTVFSWLPVCESGLPIESVMTLLTGFTGKKVFHVDLKLHGYGYSVVETEVPLTQLLAYCVDAGCTPYVGIESTAGDTVTGSLFLLNRSFGYCHSLKFRIGKSMLDQEEGRFDAEAYVYTPVHNLKNL